MKEERRVALVTGAGYGIGESVARLYAEQGVAVVLADIDRDQGEKAAERTRRKGGEAAFVRVDVSDPAGCERMVKAALDRYRRLGHACNNAGIGGEQKPTAEFSIEGWQRIMSINLSSVFMKYEIPPCSRAAAGRSSIWPPSSGRWVSPAPSDTSRPSMASWVLPGTRRWSTRRKASG